MKKIIVGVLIGIGLFLLIYNFKLHENEIAIEKAYYFYTIFTNKQMYKMVEYNKDGDKILAGYVFRSDMRGYSIVDQVIFTKRDERYLLNNNIDFKCLTISQALEGCFTNEWKIMRERRYNNEESK